MEPSISSFVLLFFVHACISWEEKYDLVDCHTICYFDALLTFFSAFFYSEKSKRGKAQTEAIISKMHFSPPHFCLLALPVCFLPAIHSIPTTSSPLCNISEAKEFLPTANDLHASFPVKNVARKNFHIFDLFLPSLPNFPLLTAAEVPHNGSFLVVRRKMKAKKSL